MKLVELLNNIDYKIINGSTSVSVNDITYDSRTANKDNLFKISTLDETFSICCIWNVKFMSNKKNNVCVR